MSIINFHDPTVINWNLDDNGKPVSLLISNETKQVVDGKIPLEGLPDEQYRIQISGYVEINIKDEIDTPNKFKCDYTHGVLYFDQSKNGVNVNIDKYYSRGQFYIPSSRIWTKLSANGTVEETLKDVEGKLDVAKNLSNEIQAEENVRIQSENTRQQQEQDRQTNTINAINNINNTNNAFKVWENYDNTKYYVPLNKVQYQGSSYVNIVGSKGILPTNTTYWQLVAMKGVDGQGAGDMLKSIYDANDNGKVDMAEDSEKLGGQLPTHYASKDSVDNLAGTGRTTETVKDNADKIGILNGIGEVKEKANKSDLDEHKADYTRHLDDVMPHEVKDLQSTKTYKFGLQLSSTGQPQIIFEEVI